MKRGNAGKRENPDYRNLCNYVVMKGNLAERSLASAGREPRRSFICANDRVSVCGGGGQGEGPGGERAGCGFRARAW